VSVYDALLQCRQHLDTFGGHAAAAGLTIREARIPEFRDRLSEVLEGPLAGPAARPRLLCDVEVEPGGFLPSVVQELARLGPFGSGNPEPTVVLRRLWVASARVVGADHLKLVLTGRGVQHEAIGFRMGSLESRGLSPAGPVDIACVLETNTWNGTERVQLRLRDVRASVNG